ncbi:MAG: T9SS type A sorting domain-containing protein [Ignavibacteriaceae bacterium]
MKNFILVTLIFFYLIPASFSQNRVKILTYNILNYPNFSTEKNAKYQLIFNEAKPDVVAVQEILSQSGVNSFLSNALGISFKAATFFNGPDTDNALFYKDSIFTILTSEIIPNSPRYITKYVLQHNFTQDIIVIYIAHFKAGTTQPDEFNREQEAARLRIYTDQLSAGTNFMLLGDLNLYRSTEASYVRLLDQTNSGYFLDPVNRPGNWHEMSSFADVHTQSTRLAQLPDGGSNGGLDDRFDFILISQSLMNFGGVDYVTGSYWAYGNDGQHFNQQIVNPPYPISEEIAFALHDVSDHLPVIAEFDFGVVNDIEPINPLVTTFNLFQNYPNPFNPSTKIRFELPQSTHVKLLLYDLLGREIKIIFDGEALAGINEVVLNAGILTSGIYFYTLISKEFISTKKLTILK